MGRSRGGLTTKTHAVVDALGLPMGLSLGEGQAYDGHAAKARLNDLPHDAMVLADRAYDADSIRNLISDQGAWANIPAMPQRKSRPVFSKHLYKQRNLVERFFNKLKHFRAIATRYEKDPENHLAGVKLASTRIWIRFSESVNSGIPSEMIALVANIRSYRETIQQGKSYRFRYRGREFCHSDQ